MILLDCGFYDENSLLKYKEKEEILKRVDFIIVSSSKKEYSRALCYLMKLFDFKGKVICSYPLKYLVNI